MNVDDTFGGARNPEKGSRHVADETFATSRPHNLRRDE